MYRNSFILSECMLKIHVSKKTQTNEKNQKKSNYRNAIEKIDGMFQLVNSKVLKTAALSFVCLFLSIKYV